MGHRKGTDEDGSQSLWELAGELAWPPPRDPPTDNVKQRNPHGFRTSEDADDLSSGSATRVQSSKPRNTPSGPTLSANSSKSMFAIDRLASISATSVTEQRNEPPAACDTST